MAQYPDILIRAAEIITQRGWVQHHFGLPDKSGKGPGPVCAARAINEASAELGATERQRWDARYAMFVVIGKDSIASWNDQGKRNKQEVIDSLQKAALLPVSWVNHIN